jgi:hypothetical protein
MQVNEGENRYWDLTAYGELLYEVRVRRNCSTNWIYEFIVNPEQVREVLSQLILDVLNGS